MDERIMFLGIAFRSSGHLVWFLLSVIFFCIVIFVFIVSLRRKERFFYVYSAVYAFFYLVTSLGALQATKRGKIESVGVFSVDCIWFNATMGGIYIILFIVYFLTRKYLFQSLKQRRAKK